MELRTDGRQVSKGALWTSYILEGLIVLLLTFDWSTKVFKVKSVVEQAAKSGFSADTIFSRGKRIRTPLKMMSVSDRWTS